MEHPLGVLIGPALLVPDPVGLGGEATVEDVARGTGTAWEPLGADVYGPVYALAVDRNGDLVLGGDFTTVGSMLSPYITLYDAPGTVATEDSGGEVGADALVVAPNPLSSGGTVRMTLPEAGPVRVAVFDVLGRAVSVLADGEKPAGVHVVPLDARQLAPGMYVVRLTAGAATVVRRVTVAR